MEDTDRLARSRWSHDVLTAVTLAVVAMVLLYGVGVSVWTIAVVAAMAVVSVFDVIQRHAATVPSTVWPTWRVEVTPLVRITRGSST